MTARTRKFGRDLGQKPRGLFHLALDQADLVANPVVGRSRERRQVVGGALDIA